jgi:hypothetical protein
VRHDDTKGRSVRCPEVSCCRGDGGRSAGIGLQGQIPNRLMRLGPKALVVSDQEKGRRRPVRCESGRRTKVNRRQRVESVRTPSKPGSSCCPGISSGETCLLPERWPAQRRRELDSGSSAERGNLLSRCEGRTPSGRPARGRVPKRDRGTDRPIRATKPSNIGGAKGPNHPALSGGQPVMGGARG